MLMGITRPGPEMASLTVLAPAWRDPARRRLVSGEIEASTARLVTPTVGGDDSSGLVHHWVHRLLPRAHNRCA